MIDVHLLVYAGVLALFIVGVLVVGILALVVFTAVATTASIARAGDRRNEYADVAADFFPAQIEFEETEKATVEHPSPVADQSTKPGHDNAAENIVLRRPGRPRLIHHT